MRILHVINSLEIGGAETLLANSAPLMNESHDVTIFVMGKDDTFLTEKIVKSGVELIKISNKIIALKNLIWLLLHVRKYDIIHSHLTYAQYFVSLISIFYPNKIYITTEHNTSNKRQQNKKFKLIEKWMYSRYDYIIAISEDTKIALMNWVPNISDKINIIHNGIDYNRFCNSKVLEEFKNTKVKIIMVAGFREQKDQDTLIEAVSYLSDEYELYLVGDGERRDELQLLVSKLQLTEKVFFLGVRDDVNDVMKSCDMFVLSSHWEGFGLVAIEAMAVGIPVIVSDVPGISNVVGELGFTFKKGDALCLKNSIENVRNNYLGDENLKESMKAYARQFSIQENVRNCMKLYQSIKVKEG